MPHESPLYKPAEIDQEFWLLPLLLSWLE